MDKIKDRIKNALYICCIYAEVILCTVLAGMLCSASHIIIFRNAATVTVGIMIFVYCYSLSDDKIAEGILPHITFLISFGVSNALVAFTSIMDIGTIWMAAVAVAAIRAGIGHAVSCHALLLLQYIMLSADAQKNIMMIVFYAVTGILMALVMSEVKSHKEFIYASVIFIALTMVMVIVLSGFDLKEARKNKEFTLKCLAGDSVMLFISWVTYCIKTRLAAPEKKSGYKRNQKRDKKIILQLLEPDNMLLKRMGQYSESLYSHSVRVGRLSYKAAYHMGCDCLLAKAGGLYHEAGRIYEDRKYPEACKILITEYNFPPGLSDIVLQNAGSEKPGSCEAVIVMISDSIISTDEYFKRTEKRAQISDEKLIKSVFSKRIAKGNFSESGMSKEQIEKLMDFYINNAFKENL